MTINNKSTKEGILNYLKEHKKELQEKYGVTKIGLFGSYARGDITIDSDIDIAVEIESDNKFRSFFELKYYLEKNLGGKIDLGIESSLKQEAKKYIAQEIIYV
jgi:predicted nucleotidyltransferase